MTETDTSKEIWFLYDRLVEAYDPDHSMNDAELARHLGVTRSALWFASTHNRPASKAFIVSVAKLLPRHDPRRFFAFGVKPAKAPTMRGQRARRELTAKAA